MKIDFSKSDGLVPAIITDNQTGDVLMLGYMNDEALKKTIASGYVTFFSRSKQRLWMKGETSGNTLEVVSLEADCDRDTILISVKPNGPVCHTGTATCFGDTPSDRFLYRLEGIVEERASSDPSESYTASLLEKGINKVAQKVGEEAVELIIESKDSNDDLFLNEAADLLYHFVVLLKSKNLKLRDVEDVLVKRHQ